MFDSRELNKVLENAKVICDKLYIILGIKGTVEKVSEKR